jgi:hypothetical protein
MSGRLAFCSSDLITQIHGIFPAYDDRRAGTGTPCIDQAADPSPDVPLRELSRVGPPVWDFVVSGPQSLRRLFVARRAVPTSPRSHVEQHRADQYRADQIYHVIRSDLE